LISGWPGCLGSARPGLTRAQAAAPLAATPLAEASRNGGDCLPRIAGILNVIRAPPGWPTSASTCRPGPAPALIAARHPIRQAARRLAHRRLASR
jgi:hypothetical protein